MSDFETGHLAAEQRATVISMHADYDRIAAAIEAQLRAQPESSNEAGRTISPGSEEFKCAVAQNVLRTAIEAVLERMLPYTSVTPVELGLRLASYLVSAIPIEQQEGALSEFVRVFPDLHRRRMEQGIHLDTGWMIEGEDGERSNVPDLNS